jgi:hypothetical protein
MSYCNYCENFVDGHSIIILMNFAIPIKAKKSILNLGFLFKLWMHLLGEKNFTCSITVY